jgi:hypothetical protein
MTDELLGFFFKLNSVDFFVKDYVGHCFCKKCIAEWLNYQKTCPIDRTHLEEKSLKPVGVLIKSMIGKYEPCRENSSTKLK